MEAQGLTGNIFDSKHKAVGGLSPEKVLRSYDTRMGRQTAEGLVGIGDTALLRHSVCFGKIRVRLVHTQQHRTRTRTSEGVARTILSVLVCTAEALGDTPITELQGFCTLLRLPLAA